MTWWIRKSVKAAEVIVLALTGRAAASPFTIYAVAGDAPAISFTARDANHQRKEREETIDLPPSMPATRTPTTAPAARR